jgi:hypothetical protein
MEEEISWPSDTPTRVFLFFLPVFALWMLPLGLMLLADDVPPLRSARSWILDWIERRRPHWLAASPVCPSGRD